MSVCVDASIVIKCLTPEEGSETAIRLFQGWKENDVDLVAPSLIDYEVGTALRQKIVRGLLKTEDLFPVYDFYRRIGIRMLHPTDFVAQAVPAAASLEQPTIYDIAYLLVAKQQKADFVTADEKFYQAVVPIYSFVRFYRDLV